jgi:hypothetical protein
MNSRLINKNLSKRSRLKKKKQQLCDKINQCESLKELEGWERTFSYHPVLKDDQDWDEGFFFNLIEFKLKRMSQYFHTHHIVENEDWYGTLCDRAIAILNAGYKTDIILDSELKYKGIYVNTRNINRFMSPKQLDFILKKELSKYYRPTVREIKAKALFWKYLHHYVEYLWE